MGKLSGRSGRTVEVVDDVQGVVLCLRGRLGVDMEAAVKAGFDEALGRFPTHIVVDFSEAKLVTSPVIKQLARCHRGQLARAGTVALSGLTGSPYRALETAGVLGYIGHWEARRDALAAGAA